MQLNLILQALLFDGRPFVSRQPSDQKSVAEQVESSLDPADPKAVHEAVDTLELSNSALLHERENACEGTI